MCITCTPIPVNGPCIHRRYDPIFNRYYCELTYETLEFKNCTCDSEDIRTVKYIYD